MSDPRWDAIRAANPGVSISDDQAAQMYIEAMGQMNRQPSAAAVAPVASSNGPVSPSPWNSSDPGAWLRTRLGLPETVTLPPEMNQPYAGTPPTSGAQAGAQLATLATAPFGFGVLPRVSAAILGGTGGAALEGSPNPLGEGVTQGVLTGATEGLAGAGRWGANRIANAVGPRLTEALTAYDAPRWLEAIRQDVPWLGDLITRGRAGVADFIRLRTQGPDLLSGKFQAMEDGLRANLPSDLRVPLPQFNWTSDALNLARRLQIDPASPDMALVERILGQNNLPARAQQQIPTLGQALDQIKAWKISPDRSTRNLAYQAEDSMVNAIAQTGRQDLADSYRRAIDQYRKGQRVLDFLNDSGGVAPGSTVGPITDQPSASSYLWKNLPDYANNGRLELPNLFAAVNRGALPGATDLIADPVRGHLRVHVPGTPLSIPLGVRIPAQAQGYAGTATPAWPMAPAPIAGGSAAALAQVLSDPRVRAFLDATAQNLQPGPTTPPRPITGYRSPWWR